MITIIFTTIFVFVLIVIWFGNCRSLKEFKDELRITENLVYIICIPITLSPLANLFVIKIMDNDYFINKRYHVNKDTTYLKPIKKNELNNEYYVLIESEKCCLDMIDGEFENCGDHKYYYLPQNKKQIQYVKGCSQFQFALNKNKPKLVYVKKEPTLSAFLFLDYFRTKEKKKFFIPENSIKKVELIKDI